MHCIYRKSTLACILLTISTDMAATSQKILIIDEDGFSKVCSAMLSKHGYETRLAVSTEDAAKSINSEGIELIISSYPYGLPLLKMKDTSQIPVIVLSDEVNTQLVEVMSGLKQAVCMLKPIDFKRFEYLVQGILNGYLNLSGGNIIG